ncbi:MAG: hypothetical protein ABI024_13680 [Vicinamibacterales bacterium]
MPTLVHSRSRNTSYERPSSLPAHDTSLSADYLDFDRQRTYRRQYMKAFGGMAIIVLLGALFGRVPMNEAWIVAGLLMSAPLALAVLEGIQWRRLKRRLDRVRANLSRVRKS